MNVKSVSVIEKSQVGVSMKGLNNIVKGVYVIRILALFILLYGVISLFFIDFKTKISNSETFDDKCISDEIGFVGSDENAAISGLKTFYDKTGIQPYVVFHAYDSSVARKEDLDEYAKQWYSYEVSNENSILLMYFAGEDVHDDEGYYTTVVGENAKSVMDGESLNLLYDKFDSQWTEDVKTSSLIGTTFSETADDIMIPMWPTVICITLSIVLLIGTFVWSKLNNK